ncbi:MAG: PHP domain-containing protein [Chloroflexi bacterium]|nr:PHP domain-containing protein [Chloroflexota bacterium]
MYIDMHCHSVSSDDSRAPVEQYLKWIQVLRRRGYRVDGIFLTEHRKFDGDRDYRELGQKYGVLVLKGSELDTRFGHFLVYNVTPALVSKVDFVDVAMDPFRLIAEAEACGALAVPAHPGRFGIGLCDFLSQGVPLGPIRVVERLNGSSRKGENERAEEICLSMGLAGIGGSDAHFVSSIGSCLTEFKCPVRDERDVVAALRSGQFRAVRLEETRESVPTVKPASSKD